MIRVLLADDHEIVRLGLRSVLEREPQFAIVGDLPLHLRQEEADAACSALQTRSYPCYAVAN